MKNIISYLKDQNYLNEYDSTQSISQIIKQIIVDKDCEIASINQKNEEINDFDKKLKAAYSEKNYTEQYIRKTICQKLSINSKRTKLSQLFDYFISNYKNSSEDQNLKKNLDEIKSFLIEQGIAESDQDKPEIVLIKQIVKEKNLKIKALGIERKKMRQLIIDMSKEKEEVNKYLINEGVIQTNDKINYKNIISSIISEKEQLIKQVDSLRSANESLSKKDPIKDDKLNSKELISSFQEEMMQHNLKMSTLIEKLQKQYNQSQANENEDSESKSDHFELNATRRNKLKLDTNTEIFEYESEIISSEKDVLDELIQILNVSCGTNSNEKVLENKYAPLIQKIKDMKRQIDINNSHTKQMELCLDVETFEHENNTISHEKEVLDELIQILNVSCNNSFNENASEREYTSLIDKIIDMKHQIDINSSQKKEMKLCLDIEAFEHESNVVSQEKEVLDELIQILNVQSNMDNDEKDTKLKYDPLINKIKAIKDQRVNGSDEQIRILEEKNNDLIKENEQLQQQKDSSDELLRRHVLFVKTENDKQLRRLKFLQQMEIKEIVNMS